MFDVFISLIIPVYNSESYISKLFHSIQEQKYSNFEVIFVDDGSIDNTRLLIKKFIKNYSGEASFISIRNSGSNPARMIGVKKAKYDYITFADSDDVFDSEYLSTFSKQIEDNIDIISNSAYSKDGDGIHKIDIAKDAPIIIKSTNFDVLKRLYSYDGICDYFWNKLFKKDLFEGVDMSNRMPFEELRTMHLIFEKARAIKIINEPHYYYIHRVDSQSYKKPLINYYKYEARKDRYFYTILYYKNKDLENMISYRLVDDYLDLIQDEKISIWKKDFKFIKKVYSKHKSFIDTDKRLKRHIKAIIYMLPLYKLFFYFKNRKI